jgi:Yip1 domain
MNPNQGPGEQGYPPPPGGQGYPPPSYPPPGYVPPPGYGAPPPGAYPPPAPAGINGLFRKWINVTTRPGAASFAAELPTANWRDIWLSIMGLAVLTIITTYLGGLEFGAAASPNLSQLTPDQRRVITQFLQAARPEGGAAVGSIIGVPLGFFILVGILFLFARLFGGTGTFLQQAYAFALYHVPIQGVSAVLGLIPFLGGLAGFALGIYSIVLAVFAVAASQRLMTGRAVAVVLLPLAIVLVLLCGLFFVFVALLVSLGRPH